MKRRRRKFRSPEDGLIPVIFEEFQAPRSLSHVYKHSDGTGADVALEVRTSRWGLSSFGRRRCRRVVVVVEGGKTLPPFSGTIVMSISMIRQLPIEIESNSLLQGSL